MGSVGVAFSSGSCSMLYPDREYHKGKVRLVFAGQESLNGYQQIAAKFESNPGFSTKSWDKPRRLEIRLPDRTLYVTAKGSRSNVLLPVSTDAIVSLKRDMNQWKTLDTDMLLFNPIHAPKSLNTYPYRSNGIDILIDSGGFQLIQGTSDFVSPQDTVDFYNRCASIGVGLDFPAPPFVDALLYRENCNLQKINNAFIRANVKERVTIAPVVHGTTPKTRQHCLETVWRKGRDPVITISGMISKRGASLDVMKQRLACLALVLSQTRKDVVYYHLLGATSIFWHAVNTLLATSGYVNSIGGDSVSHRQASIGGSYSILPHFDGPASFRQPVVTEQAAHLPCSCPICVIAGDARVLRDFRISELHHTFVAASVKKYVEENVKQYVRGNLSRTQLRKAILGEKSADSVWLPYTIAFDYFEEVFAKGYDKVKPLIGFDGIKAGPSLFSQVGTRKQEEMIARYRAIHKAYGKFHGTKITA